MQASTIRRAALLVAVAVASLPAYDAVAPAASQKVVKTKTFKVKPSGKSARLQLVAKGTTAYLTLSVKKGSRYSQLAKKKLRRKLQAGYSDVRLTSTQGGDAYAKNGGQGLISWEGATDDGDYAEYFGWNIDRKKIEMYGVDEG